MAISSFVSLDGRKRKNVNVSVSSKFNILETIKSSSSFMDRNKETEDPQRYETLEEIAAKDCKIFSFETLDAATTNFGDCIGKGGFGAVYKGRLKNGKEIAVKKLSNTTLHTNGRRMAYELYTNGRSLEFLDPVTVDPTVTNTEQVISCIDIALLCVQGVPTTYPVDMHITPFMSGCAVGTP